jgi:YidC/Oxa1 family membrane protein insertase
VLGQIGYFFNIIFTYPIFNVLMLLYHLFGDFGLSIIVLTIIIRLILVPLTMQQLRSQKATQAIQPQVAEIRKKYAKDMQAQQQALQALYKEYGVNPLAGCLPLLIQLPVLYGLFYALNDVLRNASIQSINSNIYPFLPKLPLTTNLETLTSLNWFTFINPAWHIALSVPDPTHILPVLAGLATFIQLRMSQPRTTTGSKDAMTQQMQMMSFVMPFITFFFALNFAAGLALYWTTSSIFGIVQQYFITGWGALLVMPNLFGSRTSTTTKKNSNTSTYTGDRAKETRLLRNAEEPKTEVSSTANNGTGKGPVERNLQSEPHGNSSTAARRRSRNSSASARRRGTAPRRNPSRG